MLVATALTSSARHHLDTTKLKAAKVPIYGKWYFPEIPAGIPLLNLETGEQQVFPGRMLAREVIYVPAADLLRASLGPEGFSVVDVSSGHDVPSRALRTLAPEPLLAMARPTGLPRPTAILPVDGQQALADEDASDLASETFRKAWEGLPKIHEKWKFLHWLYSIASHVALDHLRRNKARPPFLEYPSDDQTAKDTVRFEDSVEEWELVKLALMQVAPKPRACLLLQLQGLSQDEVARLLGLNRKSVGTYVSMAREQFRQAYHRLANS